MFLICFLPCLACFCPSVSTPLWPPCLPVCLLSLSLCLHLFRMDLPSSDPQDTMLRNPQPCECHPSPALDLQSSPFLPLHKVMRVSYARSKPLLRLTSLPFSPPSLRGFCFFNSVAITTKLLQQKLNVGKVLIVDWVSSELLGPGSTFRKPPPNPPPLPRLPMLELA